MARTIVPVKTFPLKVASGWSPTRFFTRADGSACPVSRETSKPIFYDSFLAPRGDAVHHAIDVTCAWGTPVVSPVDGEVPTGTWTYRGEARPWVGRSERGGYYAWIRDAEGNTHYFAHLAEPSPLRPGQSVRAGQLVGYCGESGNAHGGCPHLHYQIRDRYNQPINPFPLLRSFFEAGDWAGKPVMSTTTRWLWLGGAGVLGVAIVGGLLWWLRGR
ncbi:MAG: M23 family metallopeptidase [Gemmatimonadota bacterium]|nr:MAG: M23 family metallopeptidase [Gemmatimonadota bacterium]